jgi:endoglycosylceramidase
MIARHFCFLVVVAFLAEANSPNGTNNTGAALPFIRTGGLGDPFFYDDFNRVRIFHGANRVKKAPPWYFEDMVNSDAEYDMLEALGFTVIRLGYMWTGAEPEANIFNQTYIDTIKTIVGKLADRGIYTLLDMHEDVLSSKFCLYDGVPLWVIDKSTPLLDFPWPLKGNCSRGWETNSLSLAAATAYQNIYDNHKGMLDDLVGFWTESAKQFATIPGVIGYETMNEPQPGNFFVDPELGVPGVAGAKNLMRMHEAVAAGIRTQDQRHIVFYEPVTWGMVFNGTVTGSGFTQVPGGAAWMNTSAYSYHW